MLLFSCNLTVQCNDRKWLNTSNAGGRLIPCLARVKKQLENVSSLSSEHGLSIGIQPLGDFMFNLGSHLISDEFFPVLFVSGGSRCCFLGPLPPVFG